MRKILKIVKFFFFYITEIIVANWRVAYDILTIKQHYHDGLIQVYIGDISPVKLAVLINLITMTPGTICLSFDIDSEELTVHLMFMDEAEKIADKIRSIYLPFVKEIIPC